MRTRTKNAVIAVLILFTAAAIALILIQWRRYDQHQKLLQEYPVHYETLIQTYAEEYELDPYLVLSIMRRESSFDPNAASGKGAIGLMQIMPDTGEWIAHKLEEEPFDPSCLYDPETNIRYGCWFLSFLNRRLKGVTTNIIAAYNAGHGTVEGWLSNRQYCSDGVLTEIPFEETARYLERVNDAYEQYRSLYPSLFSGAVAGTDGP